MMAGGAAAVLVLTGGAALACDCADAELGAYRPYSLRGRNRSAITDQLVKTAAPPSVTGAYFAVK